MRTLTFFIVLLSLAGALDASLALKEHYNTEASPCSINAKWDCGTVNHSMFAEYRGVPVAIIGIMGYAFLAAIAGRWPRITLAAALIGLAFSLRLTYIEWKELLVWCIYCVTSQGIIAVITLLAIAAVVIDRRTQRRAAA
jgi:vitamin-K-epoxide reductase (warfarin-sensitive)